MRCDDATNMHGRERYRKFGRKYSKENFIRKISSQTEKQNTVYSRKVEMSMWIGLIWFRMSGNHGI